MRKIFTLLSVCVMAAFAVQAADIAVDFPSLYGDATVQPATEVTASGLTFTFEKGNSGTEPAYFVNSSVKEMRLYGGSASAPEGNVMTIKATSNITKIVIDHGSNCTWAELQASTGTISQDADHNATWTGNASEVSITVLRGSKATQYRFATMTVTVGGDVVETVAKPSVTPAAGTYYAPFEATLKCGTADAQIYYTLNGSEPSASSTLYTAPIAISSSCTLKAIAIKGSLKSEVLTAEYVFGTATQVANIAAYKALPDSTRIMFTGTVTALAQYGNYLFVQDNTGNMLIYGSTGKTYKNGMTFSGFSGLKITYNGEPELSVSATDGFVDGVQGAEVEPELIQAADVEADLFGHFVLIKGATLGYTETASGAKNLSSITDASGTAVAYNRLGANISDYTKTYNVTAIIGSYRNASATETTYQVYPVKLQDVEEGVIPEVADVEALYALDKGKTATITSDLVAIYQNGRRLFVKNNDSYALVYGNLTNTFANGDVISNAQASWTEYQGAKQLTPVDETFVVARKGAAVQPQVIPLEEVGQDMVHYYLRIENATLVNDSTKYYTVNDGTIDMIAFNQFEIDIPTDLAGKTFNINAFVTLYKGIIELYPVLVEEAGADPADVSGDGNIDVTDLNIVINVALDKDSNPKADISGDGVVDVTDINLVLNAMLRQ